MGDIIEQLNQQVSLLQFKDNDKTSQLEAQESNFNTQKQHYARAIEQLKMKDKLMVTQSNLMTSHLKELKLALQVNDSKVSHLEAQNENL